MEELLLVRWRKSRLWRMPAATRPRETARDGPQEPVYVPSWAVLVPNVSATGEERRGKVPLERYRGQFFCTQPIGL